MKARIKKVTLFIFLLMSSSMLFSQTRQDVAIRNLEKFDQQWKSDIQKYVEPHRSRLIDTQDQIFQRDLSQAKLRFDQYLQSNTKAPSLVHAQVSEIEKLKTAKIDISKNPKIGTDAALISTLPLIEQVLSAPPQNEPNKIKLGGFVMIKGKYFGEEHGAVGLRYQEEAFEFQQLPPSKVVELTPIDNNWERAWADNLLIMKLPEELPANNTLHPKGELIVARKGDNAKTSFQVTLNLAGPMIHSITASPEYGDWETKVCAVSGGVLTLYGTDLGDEPGRVFLELSEPINGSYELDLGVLKWSDLGILVQVPRISGLDGYQATLITVERKTKSLNKKVNTWSSSI